MKENQIIRLLDGDAWMEYCGHLYEYIGRSAGRNVFSDVNDGEPLFITDYALRNSTEFYFTEKY